MDMLKIALAQLDPVVGDVSGNLEKARRAVRQETVAQADLLVFPELFLAGYPPEDLVLRTAFQQACREAAQTLAREAIKGPAILIGLPWLEQDRLYNAVALLDQGEIRAVQFKHDLPNYGVFDEKRVFAAGPLPRPLDIRGARVGVAICEDIWTPATAQALKAEGADLILALNASPYWRGKARERLEMARQRVTETGVPLVYLNCVGGQDELVFDGGSFAMRADGASCGAFPRFGEQTALLDWTPQAPSFPENDDASDYTACMMGLRDYVRKNGFSDVLLGLSGGIDSALCAAMAVDALGPDHVRTFMLPHVYTSPESLDDATACAQALGVSHDVVSISSVVEKFETTLAPLFSGTVRDVTEENLQSRIRGTLLMALSNKTGAMLLTTGNKSEVATGYATLYGDMNGGFNPLKDVYKTQVFRMTRLRNRWKAASALGPEGAVVPERILTKPPSAELRAGQKDQDSLPPYEVLDAILDRLVDQDQPTDQIIKAGFDASTVQRVVRLVNRAEYKRQQAAPGVKISRRSFGRDRRYPITNGFVEVS